MYTNPADYVIKILSVQAYEGDVEDVSVKKERVQQLVTAWDNYTSAATTLTNGEREVQAINTPATDFKVPVGASWLSQVIIMTSRYTFFLPN